MNYQMRQLKFHYDQSDIELKWTNLLLPRGACLCFTRVPSLFLWRTTVPLDLCRFCKSSVLGAEIV